VFYLQEDFVGTVKKGIVVFGNYDSSLFGSFCHFEEGASSKKSGN